MLLRAPALILLCLAATAASAEPGQAATSHQEAADFLYREAEQYRQQGELAEAIRNLREVLILDPEHPSARRTLSQLERTAAARRQQAMEDVLSQVATARPGEAAIPVTVAVASSASVRLPDPRVNGVKWFYVFGQQGNPDYGALKAPQRLFIEVPSGSSPVSVRVVDADISGRYDELDGPPDTSTVFRVMAGEEVLESRTVGPQTPQGTTLAFGPYPAAQGKPQGGQAQFCVEAEGLEGNDNNLFAVEVSPASARCYSTQPAIRMAEPKGTEMEFFPEVPPGTSRVIVEQNYDLDPDGGRVEVIPATRDGRRLRRVRVKPSGSGTWSKTEIPVPPGADGARWTYRIVKATQRAGNMSFRMSDQSGQPLPVHLTRDGRRLASQPRFDARREAPAAAPLGCNVFEFDASASSDPDRGGLTYRWDFGDGRTAEGVRVEHTYADGGRYRVRLKVQDDSSTACCVSEVEQWLPVNLPPKPVIEAPQKACAGSAVQFGGAKTTDTLGERLTYHWDFGDGTTADGELVDHAYVTGGTYQVTLTVQDDRNTPCSKAQAVSPIHVNSPPIITVSDAIRTCAAKPIGPMEVAFSAAGSRDPDGDAVTYSWDFGDGTPRGLGEQLTHTYQQGGRYTAVVTADDGSGSACATSIGVVAVQLNHPPVAVADLPSTGCPEALVTLNATNSSDVDGQALTYLWDFGDGHGGEGATVQHAYPASGSFRARLTVRDSSGMRCDTASADVPVLINAPPVARMKIRGSAGLVLDAAADAPGQRSVAPPQ